MRFQLVIALLIAAASAAAEYPERPVRVIVPSAPGGGPDVTTRIIAGELSRQLGKQFVVDNRPGASGVIGMEMIAHATPDGYTIGQAAFSSLIGHRFMVHKLRYDPDRDIRLVAQYSIVPNILAVANSLPVKSVSELVDHARRNPGKLLFASSGTGTSLHLAGELFKRMTNTQITHVPYKSAQQGVSDMIGGQVHMMFDNASSIGVHVKAGRVRGLAVTSVKRSSSYPELPTVAESGVPNFEAVPFGGIVAPGGVSKAIVDRLNAEVNKAVATSMVRDRFSALGSEPTTGTSEEFTAFVKREVIKWAEVINGANIRME